MPSHEQGAPGSPNPFASGILFAKRKKSLFKGPTLNFGGTGGSSNRSHTPGGHSRSASGSALGRRSGEVTIQEEDEDHVAEEEAVEEVDRFTPVVIRPGETVEEQIIEAEEPTPTKELVTPTPEQKTFPSENNTPTPKEKAPGDVNGS